MKGFLFLTETIWNYIGNQLELKQIFLSATTIDNCFLHQQQYYEKNCLHKACARKGGDALEVLSLFLSKMGNGAKLEQDKVIFILFRNVIYRLSSFFNLKIFYKL